MIGFAVTSSIPSNIFAPSAPDAVIPCSGENSFTILNPASINAFLLKTPVFVFAASLVNSPMRLVFQLGALVIMISIPNLSGIANYFDFSNPSSSFNVSITLKIMGHLS